MQEDTNNRDQRSFEVAPIDAKVKNNPEPDSYIDEEVDEFSESFDDSNEEGYDEGINEDEEDESEDIEEELFRENPLKAIWMILRDLRDAPNGD